MIAILNNYIIEFDDEDLEFFLRHKWRVVKTKAKRAIKSQFAIQAFINGKTQKFHRILLNAPIGLDVDHLDGNTLNNQKKNLRICTRVQNLQNTGKYNRKKGTTSSFKGVSWRSDSNNWRARIKVGTTFKGLGSFNNEVEAAKAYNKAALTYFGEFARLNEV